MKLSLRSVIALHPLLLVAACAHNPPPAPRETAATATLTAAEVKGPAGFKVERPTPDAAHTFSVGPEPIASIDQWGRRFPDAAAGLGEWAQANDVTAHELARWQKHHPEKMEVLIDWTVTHLYEPLGAFLFDRVGWADLEKIAAGSDDLSGFMTWVRRAPKAAIELGRHTDGLAFADEHAASLAQMNHSEAQMRTVPVGKTVLTGATVPAAPSPAPSPAKSDPRKGTSGERSPVD